MTWKARFGWWLLPALLLGSPTHTLQAAEPAVSIPFELREGLMLIQVHVHQQDQPLCFLFDTGASVTTIDTEVASRVSLRFASKVSVRGIGGTTTGHWPVRFSGETSGVQLPRRVLAIDLKPLSAACGFRVDGLLGADFLENRVLRINFSATRIELLEDSTIPLETASVRLKRNGSAFLVPIEVNENPPQWFRLDTGCNSALHWVSRDPGDEAAPVAGFRRDTFPTIPVSARIGNQELPRLDALLHSKPLFPKESGLVGTAFLTNFLVTIDARNHRLLLQARISPATLASSR